MPAQEQNKCLAGCLACCARLRACCGRMCGWCSRWTVNMAPTSAGEIRTAKFWQALVAELVGTLFFVMLGCGAWLNNAPVKDGATNGTDPDGATTVMAADPIRIAFTFGFAYAVLVYALRYISGGHLNPVVSLAAVVTRKLSPCRALLYSAAQCLGALVGAAILWAFTHQLPGDVLGATVPRHDVTQSQAFAVEFFGTMVFLFIVTACKDIVKGEDNPIYAHPFVLGLTLIVVELYAIPYTGGGFNPARSFGPAIVKNEWRDHWVYWFGPILGGLAGALIYDSVFSSAASLSRVRKCMLANEPPRKKKNQPGTEAGSSMPEEQSLRCQHTPSPDNSAEEIELKVEGDASEKSLPAHTP